MTDSHADEGEPEMPGYNVCPHDYQMVLTDNGFVMICGICGDTRPTYTDDLRAQLAAVTAERDAARRWAKAWRESAEDMHGYLQSGGANSTRIWRRNILCARRAIRRLGDRR